MALRIGVSPKGKTDHLGFRSFRPKYSIAISATTVEATIAAVWERPMAAYRSSFHVMKTPRAMMPTATNHQCWPDEEPNTVTSRTSQSVIGIPSNREGTTGRLHTPYLGGIQIRPLPDSN